MLRSMRLTTQLRLKFEPCPAQSSCQLAFPQPPENLIKLLKKREQEFAASVRLQPFNGKKTSGGIGQTSGDRSTQPITNRFPYRD